MSARVIITALMLALAVGAFWANPLGGGPGVDPLGIVFLALIPLVWFAWPTVRAGFRSAKNESDLPIIRLAGTAMDGLRNLMRKPERHRSSSS
jgi:hypothetical protein